MVKIFMFWYFNVKNNCNEIDLRQLSGIAVDFPFFFISLSHLSLKPISVRFIPVFEETLLFSNFFFQIS